MRIALAGNDGFDDGHAAESGYIAEYADESVDSSG
jgi:hypothetical protein